MAGSDRARLASWRQPIGGWLARRAPATCSARGLLADERGRTLRAGAAVARRPSIPVEPAGWRLAPVGPDGGHGPARHPPDVVAERTTWRTSQISRRSERMQAHPPKDFICHPVAHPRENRLIQQHRLDRRPVAAPQVAVYPVDRKTSAGHGRRQLAPPLRRPAHRHIQPQTPEHPRIRKHQHSARLSQDQMIVAALLMPSRLHPQLARHAQMNPQPPTTRKSK